MKIAILLISLGIIGMITSSVMIFWSYFSKTIHKKKSKVIIYKQKKTKEKREKNIKQEIDNYNDDTMLLDNNTNNDNDNDDTILLNK